MFFGSAGLYWKNKKTRSSILKPGKKEVSSGDLRARAHFLFFPPF